MVRKEHCMARMSLIVVLLLAVCLPVVSEAQNPHFTRCEASTVEGTLLLTGQIAGLGNQQRPPTPLLLVATATAACVDPTTSPPTLLGTTPVADSVTYPPKNGNRRYTFFVDTPFVLPCEPPAEVVFVSVEVCDVTHDICCPEPEPSPAPE
jgi:hypothetical protein